MARPTSESQSHAFASAGLDYYIAGRYAVFAGLIPVAGNLLHHGVEMCLKGGLSKNGTPLQDLKRLSHDLPTIWGAFRVAFPDPSLDKFGTLVGSLHTFEELRYPDSILAKGMAATFGVERPSAAFLSARTTPARKEPVYELYLQDVDALMDKLFEVASINLMFFLPGLRPLARRFLLDGNTSRWGTL